MFRIIIGIIIGLLITNGYAKSMPQPLPPDKAFQFNSHVENKSLVLEWQMAPGYYLYRDKFQITPAATCQIKFGKAEFPAAKIKKDAIHGVVQVYFDTLKIPVPIIQPVKSPLDMTVAYQGCSMSGFCYAPEKKYVHVDLKSSDEVKNLTISNVQHKAGESEQDYAEGLFDGCKSNYAIILTFLGLGLLLAFTPCVLPMVPILSGIILGHKRHMTTWKAFFLSLAYVLGMAITYAIAGVFVAMIGSRIQTFFQATWVIVTFSGLFVLLALSLFGFYELALPAHWQQRITALSNRQKGGSYLGVFLMGVLSSLIVSPCVSAPLVGVLAYIAQTGDIVFGAVALLALGLGMGIPLILIGISAGKLLPKAGSWMLTIERMFGIFLLAFAIWMLSRVIPGPAALFLWAILLVCTATYMGVFSESKTNGKKLLRGLGLVLLIYGIILILGAVLGNSDPLRPLEGLKFVSSESVKQRTFAVPKSMMELDEQLAAAKLARKPVLLDFYADWCTACVDMDRNVFTKTETQQLLDGYVLLRADVTKNDAFDQALLKRFNVIAPPTMIFFDRDGKQLTEESVVGEEGLTEFDDHIRKINLTQ